MTSLENHCKFTLERYRYSDDARRSSRVLVTNNDKTLTNFPSPTVAKRVASGDQATCLTGLLLPSVWVKVLNMFPSSIRSQSFIEQSFDAETRTKLTMKKTGLNDLISTISHSLPAVRRKFQISHSIGMVFQHHHQFP